MNVYLKLSAIFLGELSNIDELALFLSFFREYLSAIIESINHSFRESYGLEWVSNPVSIEGREANLRKFFKDFYYEGVGNALYACS